MHEDKKEPNIFIKLDLWGMKNVFAKHKTNLIKMISYFSKKKK